MPTTLSLSPELARERVANGAAFLDEKVPGWASQIDVGVLDISECDLCVLGQVRQRAGHSLLRIYDPDYGFECSVEIRDALVACDFGPERELIWLEIDREFQLLRDAWIEVIADRVVEKPITAGQPVALTR